MRTVSDPEDDRLVDSVGDVALNPLAIVIAAYNEEPSIGDVLARIPPAVCGLATSVIVVADGCTDGTAAVAGRAGAIVCDAPRNRGQGAALRVGYRIARRGGAHFIATLDADGQYQPEELAAVVQPLLDGTADFVSGSRRLGTAARHGGLRERGVVLFAFVLTVLARQKVTDPANGLRAMRAELTGAVRLAQPQYQASELLLGAALAGYRLAEAPTTMTSRTAGSSKKGGNVLYGVRFARAIAMTWWHGRRR